MQWGLLFICLAAISWGTTGTTMMLLTQVTPVHPLVVGFWRLAIAAPVLLLLAYRNSEVRRLPSRHEWLGYLKLGACMALYQVSYFWAVSLSGVAIAALVAICSSPLFIVLLAAWRLGERLTAKIYLSLGLGVLGTVLLVANPEAIANYQSNFLIGVVLALGSGFSYALYVVLAKAQLSQDHPAALAAFSFTAAALLLTPVLVLQPPLGEYLKVLPYFLYLGIVPTGIAYAFYMAGLHHTSAATAGIAVLLEPLTATLLGVWVFKEPMGVTGIIGAGLLLGAIALLSIKGELQSGRDVQTVHRSGAEDAE